MLEEPRRENEKDHGKGKALFRIVFVCLLSIVVLFLLPFLGWGREVRAIAGATVILLSAANTGLWFIKGKRKQLSGRELFQATGLGLGVYALGMFYLAAMQAWSDLMVGGFFLVIVLAGLPNIPVLVRSMRHSDRESQYKSWSILEAVLLVLTVIFAGFLLIYAFLPTMNFDGLEYHLGVPWAYWQKGGMQFLPHLFYSNFPMNMEMLLTLAWRIGGESGVQVFHYSLGMLTTYALFLGLCRRIGRTGALLGALVFLTDFQIMTLTISTKIDLGLIFFSYLAFESLMDWWKTGKKREAILCSVFTGIAIGCKYSAIGIVGIPIGIGFIICLVSMRKKQPDLKILFHYGLLIAILFSPWAAKNWIYQGNPVFPLGYSVFGAKTMDDEIQHFMTLSTDATWPDEIEGFAELSTSWEKLREIWFILTQGQLLVTLFLIIFPLLLIDSREQRLKRMAWLCLIGYLIWIFLSRPLPRYLLPLYPMLVLLLVSSWRNRKGKGIEYLVWGLLGLLVVHNYMGLSLVADQLPSAPRYLLRQLSREEILFRSLPHFEAIEFLNRRLEKEPGKALFVAEARGYGCKIPYDLNSVYDHAILLKRVEEEMDSSKWSELLSKAGYTHLLYNAIELARYRKAFDHDGWREGQRIEDTMKELQRTGKLNPVYTAGPTQDELQITVYKIINR